MQSTTLKLAMALAIAFCASTPAAAKSTTEEFIDQITQAVQSRTDKAPCQGLIESAFSPDVGSEQLVVKVINTAKLSLRLAAYSFTSPTVVKALMNAK